MTYRIRGVEPSLIDRFRKLDDIELERQGARRVVATAKPGFPCRATLDDAEPGEPLILFNFTSHDVSNPYRSSYAIFVREKAVAAAEYIDEVPPVFRDRPLSLRCFDAEGMLRGAFLAPPNEVDVVIREALSDETYAYIDVHNAAHGCFAARVERA